MKPVFVTSLILGFLLVAGAAFFIKRPSAPTHGPAPAALATDATGAQIIKITAKDGYSPATTRARAGTPVVLKIKTTDTLDCSAGLRIPALGWSQHLAPTGEVVVQIPAQAAGTVLNGVCSMGMQTFKITFE